MKLSSPKIFWFTFIIHVQKASDEATTAASDSDNGTSTKKEKVKLVKEQSQEERDAHIRSELEMKEYYIKDKYKTTAQSLKLFKDDELCSLPGELLQDTLLSMWLY